MGNSLTSNYGTAATPVSKTASAPFHDLAKNQIWLQLTALAQDNLRKPTQQAVESVTGDACK